jgi:hypothetical protein
MFSVVSISVIVGNRPTVQLVSMDHRVFKGFQRSTDFVFLPQEPVG